MADRPSNPNDLARHARQHLESLKAAGIEWLPKGAARSSGSSVAGLCEARPGVQQTSGPASERPATEEVSLFEERVAAAAAAPAEQRRRELALLAEQVRPCQRCSDLVVSRTQTVFGVGAVDPEVCFIGEAPGGDEDRLGEPFVGAAGQLLNRILAACGMTREEVYICNILKCRPPGNRTPRPDEAANCREYLDRQLALVRPKYICCLGGCAAQNLLGTTAPLGKLRGRFHDYNGIPVLCTYHPAFLLPHRQPEKKKDVWEDMKMLLARMGKPVPTPQGRPG
jgi:uracil-DNA glycosylase family 4